MSDSVSGFPQQYEHLLESVNEQGGVEKSSALYIVGVSSMLTAALADAYAKGALDTQLAALHELIDAMASSGKAMADALAANPDAPDQQAQPQAEEAPEPAKQAAEMPPTPQEQHESSEPPMADPQAPTEGEHHG